MPTTIEILSDEKATFAYAVVLQPTLLTGPPAPVDLNLTTYNEAAPYKPSIIPFPEEPGVHSGGGTSHASSTATATGTALTPRVGTANAFATAAGDPIGATPGAGLAAATSAAVGSAPIISTLLMHCDGDDGEEIFIDSSLNNHTISSVGTVETTTSQKKFGPTSAAFAGNNYLALDGAEDLAFGTENFTIDFWVRFTSLSNDVMLYDGRPGGTDGAYPTIYYSAAAGAMRYYANGTNLITGTTALVINAWYHIAATRLGTTTRLFVLGNPEGSTDDSRNYANAGANTPRLGLGSDGSLGLDGWMDEIRVVKGAAAWTSSFTPSTSAYTS